MLSSRRIRAFSPTSALAAISLTLGIALSGACAGSDEVTAPPADQYEDENRTQLACKPGTTKLCYSASDATRDVGLCHAGVATCLADGSAFGPCEGETTPAVETCATKGDDDCNGSTECEGVYVWAKRFGDSMEQLSARAAVDAEGNTALVGSFTGSVDLGGGPLNAPVGGEDGFVAKFAPLGDHMFTVPLAGRAIDLAVDKEGSTFVASLEGTCTITKISPYGSIIWKKDVGGEPTMTIHLATDAEGNLIAAGRISTIALDFGDGPLPLHGGGDVFVAKLNSAGNHVFSQTFGDSGAQQADGVAVDAAGTIHVLGRFDGSIDIGGSPLKSMTAPDLFVAQLTPKGEPLWAKGLYGDTAFDYAGDIAVDPSGNIVVTGSFAGHMSFDADTMTSPDNVDSLFIAKLTSAGKALWTAHVPGQKHNGSLAVDGGGNLFLTGIIDEPMDFGGGAIGKGGDGFIAKLSNGGEHLWSRAFTLGEALGARDFMAATDPAGSVLIVSGLFQGSADFGGPPLTSEGQHDIFVTRLTP